VPIPGQLNQVIARFWVKKAGTDHGTTGIALGLIRKHDFRIPGESRYIIRFECILHLSPRHVHRPWFYIRLLPMLFMCNHTCAHDCLRCIRALALPFCPKGRIGPPFHQCPRPDNFRLGVLHNLGFMGVLLSCL